MTVSRRGFPVSLRPMADGNALGYLGGCFAALREKTFRNKESLRKPQSPLDSPGLLAAH
jgi:hypothetical protein